MFNQVVKFILLNPNMPTQLASHFSSHFSSTCVAVRAVASMPKLEGGGGAERKFPNDKKFCPNLSDSNQVGS